MTVTRKAKITSKLTLIPSEFKHQLFSISFKYTKVISTKSLGPQCSVFCFNVLQLIYVGTCGTVPRDASPDLSRRFLCAVGPGQKSAGRAGQGQIFTGLSRMVVPRDKRDRDKNLGSVPSLAYPWFSPSRTHGVESKNYTSFNNVEVKIFIVY